MLHIQETLSNAWVIRPRPNPRARLRLFCFPYAGGAASIFYAWLEHVPPAIELCLIQLPGRENRLTETLFTSMKRLLDALVPAFRPYVDRPFAFFGHSMGATIGFELTRRLRSRGVAQPIHLFVSGSRAPQVSSREFPRLHHLPDEEFVKVIRGFDGTPEEVFENAELKELFLPILRADIALHETHAYTADELLACPISAFGGLQDKGVSRDDLVAWREQTRGSFRLRMLPGNHFFLRRTVAVP